MVYLAELPCTTDLEQKYVNAKLMIILLLWIAPVASLIPISYALCTGVSMYVTHLK